MEDPIKDHKDVEIQFDYLISQSGMCVCVSVFVCSIVDKTYKHHPVCKTPCKSRVAVYVHMYHLITVYMM